MLQKGWKSFIQHKDRNHDEVVHHLSQGAFLRSGAMSVMTDTRELDPNGPVSAAARKHLLLKRLLVRDCNMPEKAGELV